MTGCPRVLTIAFSCLLLAGSLLAGSSLMGPVGADEAPAVPRKGPASSTSVAPKADRGWADVPLPRAVHKGLKWLVISQRKDGGWNQDGGRSTATAKRRRSSPLTSAQSSPVQSDVGNTAFAVLAIMDAGNAPNRGVFQGPVHRGVKYLLKEVEASPEKGLQVTDRTGTQIQRKIGRYADTFLAARVLVMADGNMRSDKENKRLRKALRKVLDKIEKGQQADGSWNVAGWAPIHSTAYASQALWEAQQNGLKISGAVLEKVERFTVRQVRQSLTPVKPVKPPKRRRGKAPVVTPSGGPSVPTIGSAGVLLYCLSQGYEQLTRTPKARKKHVRQVKQIEASVNKESLLKGLGSMGGEEFISYVNINLAMARIGGDSAKRFHANMEARLAKLQNADGSWSGHHCITGRTAVTGLAVSAMLAERRVPRRD